MAWTCRDTSECVKYVNAELQRRGLISNPVVTDSVLTSCYTCRKSGSKARACTGWRLSFRGRTAVQFNPVEIRGRTVQVMMEGLFDFRRSRPSNWQSWIVEPMAACTGAVLVRTEDQLIARQHLDLANVGQPGPVWHLQLGG